MHPTPPDQPLLTHDDLSLAFDLAPVGLCVSRNRVIQRCNRAFGEMFGAIPGLKKGDVLIVDWIPGVGTQCQLNGKKIGETVPDLAFYNAILRIWIGDNPADSSLKPKLLGAS